MQFKKNPINVNSSVFVIQGASIFKGTVQKINKKSVKVLLPNQNGKSKSVENFDYAQVAHEDDMLTVVVDSSKRGAGSHYFDYHSYPAHCGPSSNWQNPFTYVTK